MQQGSASCGADTSRFDQLGAAEGSSAGADKPSAGAAACSALLVLEQVPASVFAWTTLPPVYLHISSLQNCSGAVFPWSLCTDAYFGRMGASDLKCIAHRPIKTSASSHTLIYVLDINKPVAFAVELARTAVACGALVAESYC